MLITEFPAAPALIGEQNTPTDFLDRKQVGSQCIRLLNIQMSLSQPRLGLGLNPLRS